MPGLMEIPTDPGHGQAPLWLPFTVASAPYSGVVYSLDVERWHHYVSGGAVVHNCVFLFPDVSFSSYEGVLALGGPGGDSLVRTYYVGMTRARTNLYLCDASTRYSMPL
jgi:hypothetical protein